MTAAFRIHPRDTVATLLADVAGGGDVDVRGEGAMTLIAREPIALGHKIALAEIAEGTPVLKFGIRIGIAGRRIDAGGWVHLHNCVSAYDERSGEFDLETGAAKDIRYD